jgi:protein subunit release factor B
MITLICGKIKMECSEERAAAIFRIQRKMKVNDWKLYQDADTGRDTNTNRTKATPKGTGSGKVSSK